MSLVSIVILTYNRINILIDVIKKLKNLTYKNIEIIIINNNSSDGTKTKIPELFPEIKFISLKTNIGVSALNYGLKEAKGEFIMQLDDDSYPEENAIEKGLIEFTKNRKLGLIAFKVINLQFGICETIDYEKKPKTFNGCGVMFRTIIFINAGFYNKNIFIYQNEIDLTLRVINAGYSTLYLDEAIVYHLQTIYARENKNSNPFLSEFRFQHSYFSYFVFLYENFNTYYIVKYGIKLFISNMIIAAFFGFYCAFYKTTLKIIKVTINKELKKNKINKKTQMFYNNGKPAWIDRVFFPNFTRSKLFSLIKAKPTK